MKKAKKALSLIVAVLMAFSLMASIMATASAGDIACDHVMDSGTVVTQATARKGGEMLFTCEKCGHTMVKEIPPTSLCSQPEHEICVFYNMNLSTPVIGPISALVHTMYHGIVNIIKASRAMNDKK